MKTEHTNTRLKTASGFGRIMLESQYQREHLKPKTPQNFRVGKGSQEGKVVYVTPPRNAGGMRADPQTQDSERSVLTFTKDLVVGRSERTTWPEAGKAQLLCS